MKKLWNDECGAILSAELVLVMTIVGLGMVVGMKAIQASVVTELGDVAASFGAINQSYSVAGTQGCDGVGGTTAAWQFLDESDTCYDAAGDPTASGLDVSTTGYAGG